MGLSQVNKGLVSFSPYLSKGYVEIYERLYRS